MSIAEKLQIIAANQEAVYNAGAKSEYDAFWDAYQQNGARSDYSNAFGGGGWTDETFKPKYNMQPTDAYMLFRKTGVKDLSNLPAIVDLSKAASTQYMFQWARVEQIGALDFRSCNNLDNTFAYATYLHTIEKLILREDGSNLFKNPFPGAKALQNITIEGVIGNNIDFKENPLSKASIESVFNALSTATTDNTATFKQAAVNAAFTDAEWSALVATKPNWTITLV